MPRMRRASSRNASTSETSTPSHPSCRVSPLFSCPVIRSHGRAPFHARPRCTLACVAEPSAGGMRVLTEYASTRPNPFVVGIGPRGPQPYPLDWGGLL
jgi:hypothetical protein